MLLDNANVPPLDVTLYEGAGRPVPVADEMDLYRLGATEKFERYITGEEKISLMAPIYEFFILKSDLVIECAPTDVNHRAFATFRLIAFGLEDERKVLALSRQPPNIWKQNSVLKL